MVAAVLVPEEAGELMELVEELFQSRLGLLLSRRWEQRRRELASSPGCASLFATISQRALVAPRRVAAAVALFPSQTPARLVY